MITYFEIGGEIISSDTPNMAIKSTVEQHDQGIVEITQPKEKRQQHHSVASHYMPYSVGRNPWIWLAANAWFSTRKQDPLRDPFDQSKLRYE